MTLLRRFGVFAAVLLSVLVLAPGGVQRPVAAVVSQPSPVLLTGLDAHDGTIVQDGSTYYLYGTRYGCGFHWGTPGTPWCGFGVWSSPALVGPWTFVRYLFAPSAVSPFTGQSWQWTCDSNGQGCFNPRMAKRPDGVWVLWFNAPGDYTRTGANAYYIMGCNGPSGPCGAEAGPPYGSTHKPALWVCAGNGDPSIVVDGTVAYLACTNANQTLSVERLDTWWANGTGQGTYNLAGASVESPGMFRTADGTWFLTYSDPHCGYCAGTATSYATAPQVMGPWVAPGNTGAAAPASGRRAVSATSCGGQPRTVFVADGQAWQWIDLWGSWGGVYTNQTQAQVLLVPLTPTPPYQQPPGGQPWAGGLAPFQCGVG